MTPRSMNLSTFINRLHELNAYLQEFPARLFPWMKVWAPSIIPCLPRVIEHRFNYVDFIVKEMSHFFEIRVEHLEPKEEKKIFHSL